MNNFNFLGYVKYKGFRFAIYRDSVSNRKVVQMDGEAPQKSELEAQLLDKITIHDGRGYLRKKFSLKKLFFFGGILACFSKPTILARANDYKEVENIPVESNQMMDALSGLADSISYTVNHEVMDYENQAKSEDFIHNLNQVAIESLENLAMETENTLKQEDMKDTSDEIVSQIVNSIPTDSYTLGSALPTFDSIETVSLGDGLSSSIQDIETISSEDVLDDNDVSSISLGALNQVEDHVKQHTDVLKTTNDLVSDTLEEGVNSISLSIDEMETLNDEEKEKDLLGDVSSISSKVVNSIENDVADYNHYTNVFTEAVSDSVLKGTNSISKKEPIHSRFEEVLGSQVIDHVEDASMDYLHLNHAVSDAVSDSFQNIETLGEVKPDIDISSSFHGIDGLAESKILEQQQMYANIKEQLEQTKKNIRDMASKSVETISSYDFSQTPSFESNVIKESLESATSNALEHLNSSFEQNTDFVTYDNFLNSFTNNVLESTSKIISDTNEFNEELIQSEIILYGKEDVDRLFKNKRITKEGVLSVLKENKKIPDSYKALFQGYIEEVYAKEKDPDMRVYALNLGRVKVITDETAPKSYTDPTYNEMLIHIKDDQTLFHHENDHMRNLIDGSFCIDNDVQKWIKVTGNSCINNYIGGGMREANTVSRNRQRGNDDRDYEVLYACNQILNSLFPNEMSEIEIYNDYEQLKRLFVSSGLTEEDYANFIATTDVIAKCYQERDLELDQSLVRQSITPLTEIIVNKCLNEQIDCESFINSIISRIPEGIWKRDIASLLQNCNFYVYARKSQSMGR